MSGYQTSADEERSFEKKHISAQREKYLATDVLQRTELDRGYREKVSMIEAALDETRGWVLDLGANTCGEAEVLSTRGYSIIAMDINEIALGLSRERVLKYGRNGPSYVAGDGHHIPLEDESISFVISFEVLHHMESPPKALAEIYRILGPGGKLFLFEPYAFNPYRRLSELRDKLKGTIEKSFGKKELTGLVIDSGLEPVYVHREFLRPSDWKKRDVSRVRRILKDTYYAVGHRIPSVFASLVFVVVKPGAAIEQRETDSLESILRCPVSGAGVVPVPSGFLSTDDHSRLLYPSYDGIPVLIADDAVSLDRESWEKAIQEARRPDGR